ncbi:MAG: transglycosylase SLT domain-containing protein [Synergistales bacterium]|nr:transglycosylase SLT domain-containing protein [Synergistales bacterium]
MTNRHLWCLLVLPIIPLLLTTAAPAPSEAADHFGNHPGIRYMRSLGEHKYGAAARNAISSFLATRHNGLNATTRQRYARWTTEAADEFGVDPLLVTAIMVRESNGRADATNRGSYGLMQINWRAHRRTIPLAFPEVTSIRALMAPHTNIRVGTYLFANNLRRASFDVDRALVYYKGGRSDAYNRSIRRFYEAMLQQYRRHRRQSP